MTVLARPLAHREGRPDRADLPLPLGLPWPSAGAPEPPVRSVLFGLARFEQHGRSLAATHEVASGPARANRFYPRLEDNLQVLGDALRLLERQATSSLQGTPAANWLLDNTALIDEQLSSIRHGLPRSFFRLLPRLRDAPLAGLPRIYGVAWAWVAHTDSGLDTALLQAYLGAYQQVRELTLAELWALPSTLRVVLLENLRRLAERTVLTQAASDAAHQWIDAPPAQRTIAALDERVDVLDQRGVAEAFVLQLRHRQDELPPALEAALAAWLAPRLGDATAALLRQQVQATDDHQSIRNAITTLRAIDRADWRAIFADTSAVMRTLARVPVHAAEREDTQDDTLHAVERLARRSGRSESHVAGVLLSLTAAAAREQGADAPGAAPAWWWRSAAGWRGWRAADAAPGGQAALHAALGIRPALAERLGLRRPGRAPLRPTVPVYLGGLALVVAGLLATVLHEAAEANPPTWLLALTGLLLLGPLGETVVAVVNRLIAESVQPARLPRLALEAGIPPGHRVLVVVPAMLTSLGGIAALCTQLRQHRIANLEDEAQFALLTDWADAPTAQADGDAALLDAARAGIAALNLAAPVAEGAPPRFVLLHRARTWSDSEQCWLGWERKRGKLLALVRLLADRLDAADGPSAVTGAHPQPVRMPDALPSVFGPADGLAPGLRYIVTLDADTDMPPGRLRDLVGLAAHPLNRPRVDRVARRIIAGHGILQPRIVLPLPQPALQPDSDTPFLTLFAGHGGIDPYSAASSELYQDLFGSGSFSGKGLLNVQALRWSMADALPEGQVLSHDLLEGALARCAAVSDVTLVESAPGHADVAAGRLHRWTRGDWQLLPFIAHPRRWGLSAIDTWKMVDNLRRTLVAPMALALLLLVLATSVLPLGATLVLVLAAFGAGPLLGAVAGFAPRRDDIALRLFFGRALTELGRALGVAAWHLAQLLHSALMNTDAVRRALWRLAVSHRHLLQWTTAASAQAAAHHRLPDLLRHHIGVPLVALALALLLWGAAALGAPVAAWPAALLLLLWAASPVWTWLACRPAPPAPDQQLDEADRAWLHDLARDTWRFYEAHVTAEEHHLPPDNVQFMQASPMEQVAHRTSPTNIGLYLLAAACAQALGLIDRAELARRLGLTLDTLEVLPRHHGHWANWIATDTLAELTPVYLSTVDSGNCAVHLLVTAAACEALASDAHSPAPAPPDAAVLAASLRSLAARCRVLALGMDFGFLYDRERRLLHIGWQVADQRLDEGHYDLLASESRLASMLAIATGAVPVRHWAALGRPFFASGSEVGLKSWSGSMFEYLMPSLVLAEPAGSLLWQASRSAVRVQRAEGRRRGTPWGISESAIAGQDRTLAYQYAPQGVAALALRRTPVDERVVAPYASALALLVSPRAALANLRALQALGARHNFGLVEALDYTPLRQPAPVADAPTTDFVLVNTCMAHHQAMSLVAMTVVLADHAPQRWALADPHLGAVAMLLHEPAPREVSPVAPVRPPPLQQPGRPVRLTLESAPLDDIPAPTLLLGNGRLALLLRGDGGGYAQWAGIGLTRWRDDLPRGAHGTWLYLRRTARPMAAATPVAPWHSLSAHPAPDPQARYRSRLHADRMVFDTRWPDLRVRTSVWVSPEDDCDLRQVTLTYSGSAPLELTLALVAEPTLAPQRADEAHPAFSNLFVQAHWQADDHALYLSRRPRLADEASVQSVVFLALVEGADGAVRSVSPCADRARWLGRGGSPAQPLGDGGMSAMPLPADAPGDPGLTPDPESRPGMALDTGLDPLAGLLVQVRLAAGATVRLTFGQAAAASTDALCALVDKYRQPSHVQRAASMAQTMSGIRLREWQFDAETWAALLTVNTLLSALATRELPGPAPALRPDAGPDRAPRCDRRRLWRLGLSGDRPLLVVGIVGERGLPLVALLVRALRLWTHGGLGVDLVVVNGEPPSYLAPVQRALRQLLERQSQAADERPNAADGDDAAQSNAALRGRLVLVGEAELDADERFTLYSLARLRLQADGRSLPQQMDRLRAEHRRDDRARAASLPLPVPPLLTARAGLLPSQAPEGSFDPDDGSFAFRCSPQRRPTRPWINVLANPVFGRQVSERGAGFCWAGNSRLHQVTGWSNDALGDTAAEHWLLHDLDHQRVWPLGRVLAHDGAEVGPADWLHGIGFSRLRQRIDGLDITLQWCVDDTLALSQLQIGVQLAAGRPRRLRLVAMAEWTLGASRADRLTLLTGPLVGPGALSHDVTALRATQLDHLGGFGLATAFLALRPPLAGDVADALAPGQPAARLMPGDWTCDRREFFDPAGALVLPRLLARRSGAGLDACAALACALDVGPGAPAAVTVLLGHADSPEAADALLHAVWTVDPATRLARQRSAWAQRNGAVRVQTPDARLDALVNHWLPYQTLACRLWARAGFYQAGGAVGFRDQLQDAMSLVAHNPALLAAQLRTCASRQFLAGDVQHWWHPHSGAGVRTHVSDDLLWLPAALALYLARTGDAGLLDETIPFLVGAEVPPGAEDVYESPQPADTLQGTLFEHAARAIDHSLATGAHGLPLMGSGDWNDGMNRVGHQGQGESVWLAWLLCAVIDGLAPLALARGDGARAVAWADARRGLVAALDDAGWDGRWYRRAFFDDGTPMGSEAREECRIDLIVQAWAVLTRAGDPAHAASAMASATALLVDHGAGVVRLLDPPLAHAVPDAGYIQAYPPGVRENGGQYSHGGVWALMALARLGQAREAWQVFTLLSPAHRSADPHHGAAYGLEPYAMAGDVCSQPPWVGRGGWSWYTGSAGWLLRASIESICGVVITPGRITVTPCLPPHWREARIHLRLAPGDGGAPALPADAAPLRQQVLLCADEAAALDVLAREPLARRARPGVPVELAGLPPGTVHVVVCVPSRP